MRYLFLLVFLLAVGCGAQDENTQESASETKSEMASSLDPLSLSIAALTMALGSFEFIADSTQQFSEAVRQTLLRFQEDRSLIPPAINSQSNKLAANSVQLFRRKQSSGPPPPSPPAGGGRGRKCYWGIAYSAAFLRPNKWIVVPQDPAKVVVHAYYYSEERALKRAKELCKESLKVGIANKSFSIAQGKVTEVMQSCERQALVMEAVKDVCEHEVGFISPTVIR